MDQECATTDISKRGPTYTKMIYKELIPEVKTTMNKVSVVGAGAVGMAVAFALLSAGSCDHLAIVDARKEIVQGELLDLLQGQAYYGKKTIVTADSDYVISAGSKICVLTAGARQGADESRLDLVNKNLIIFKAIIPSLLKYSPGTILIIVSNPTDIMTWAAWKISGLPKHKVIGIGTSLDSSKFRFLISEKFGVPLDSVNGFIVGESGDTSIPVWSGVTIGGNRLRDLTPFAGDGTEKDPENWDQIHKQIIGSYHEIMKTKGFLNWGLGLMTSKLCHYIINDEKKIVTISINPDGWGGVYEEIFYSIPCILSREGVSHIINMNLDPVEHKAMQEAARVLRRILDGIKL